MDDREKSRDELIREIAELRRRFGERVPSEIDLDREIELRRNEQRLKLILDGVRDHAISMLDAEGRVETFNASAARIKGYALSEVQGKYFGMFFTPEDRAAGLPETELTVARAHGTYTGEGKRLRKDGSTFDAMVSLSALRNASGEIVGFVKVTQDVTEKRRLAEEVRLARELAERERDELKQMFDAMPAMLTLLRGPELRYEFISPSAVAETGKPLDEILGQRLDAVVTDAPAGVAELRAIYDRGEPVRRTEVPVTRDVGAGMETRYYSSAIVPLRNPRGLVDGLMVFSNDVSEQVRARQAVQEANEKLQVVLEGVGDGIAMQDARGVIVYVNEAAARIIGAKSPAELLATPFADVVTRFALLDAEGRPLPPEMLPTRRAFRGERVVEQLVCFKGPHDEIERWSLVSATPMFDANGAVQYVVNIFRDVTEQRRAEAAIRESEERFRTMADAIPVLAWYAEPDGYIPWYNRRWYEYTGRTVADLQGWNWQSVHDPADVERVTAKWKHSLATGESFEDVFRLRGRDGVFRWFLTRVEPLRDAEGKIIRWFGTNVDIDEQKRTQASAAFLSRASAVLGTSLDVAATLQQLTRLAVPERADWCSVALATDRVAAELGQGQIELAAISHVDPAKADVLREMIQRYPYHRDDPGGPGRVLHTGQLEFVPEVTAAAMTEFARDREHRALMDALSPTSLVMAPLRVHGRAFGTLSLAMADASRRFTQDDVAWVEELARRVAIAIDNAQLFETTQLERRRAEEANRAKDEFLSVASHELRTPLNAILGWSRMLRSGALPEEKRARALETIERNARIQVQLVEDILDVSRIITGKLRLSLASVDPSQVVEAAVEVVRPAIDAKGVRLQVLLDPDAGVVHGDAARLQQVVWNLLSNAIKFTPKGGRVYVRLQREESNVEIVVSDSGAGIDASFLPHVFQPFRQQDASITRTHGGLGLGLAIVKHLVELHGGTIEAQSEGAGRGATFTVRIPVAPLRVSNVQPLPAQGVPAAQASGVFDCPPELADLDVLVVDDEPDARELIQSILEQCHATVRTAGSAAEAMDAIRTRVPDVLISDIGMPDESGYGLIRRVRALPAAQGGRIPAVALTAYAAMKDRTRALMEGFTAHAAKPTDPQELVAVIAALVGRYPKG